MKINFILTASTKDLAYAVCSLARQILNFSLSFHHFVVDPHVRSLPCFEILLFETYELFQLFIPYSVGTTNSLGSLHLYFVLGCGPSNIFSIGY